MVETVVISRKLLIELSARRQTKVVNVVVVEDGVVLGKGLGGIAYSKET